MTILLIEGRTLICKSFFKIPNTFLLCGIILFVPCSKHPRYSETSIKVKYTRGSTISANNARLQRNRQYRFWERVRGNGTPIRTPMTHTSYVVQCGRNPHAEDPSAREYLPKWLLALRRQLFDPPTKLPSPSSRCLLSQRFPFLAKHTQNFVFQLLVRRFWETWNSRLEE